MILPGNLPQQLLFRPVNEEGDVDDSVSVENQHQFVDEQAQSLKMQ